MIFDLTNQDGRVSFEAKFPNMSSRQAFVIHETPPDAAMDQLIIRSDCRIGRIALDDGAIKLSKRYKDGCVLGHLTGARLVGHLPKEDLLRLRAIVEAR